MIEIGIVAKTLNGAALVNFQGSEACKKCGACKVFGVGGVMQIEALNEVSAKEGDKVEVEIAPRAVLWSNFLIFIFPVLMLFLGYFLGGQWVALAFLVLSFLLLWVYDKMISLRRKTSCKIKKIL